MAKPKTRCRMKPFPKGQKNVPNSITTIYTERYAYYIYDDGTYGRFKLGRADIKRLKIKEGQARLWIWLDTTLFDSFSECVELLNIKLEYKNLRFDLPSIQAYATWHLG